MLVASHPCKEDRLQGCTRSLIAGVWWNKHWRNVQEVPREICVELVAFSPWIGGHSAASSRDMSPLKFQGMPSPLESLAHSLRSHQWEYAWSNTT